MPSARTARTKQLKTYKSNEIANLKRRQLQALCKANGIKANSKSIVLIKELRDKLKKMEEEKNILNNYYKENESINSNNCSPQKKEATKSPKSATKSVSSPIIETANENIPKPIEFPSNHNIKSQPEPDSESDGEEDCNEIFTRQLTEDIEEIIITTNDEDYNANPNGNNGSFVDIANENDDDVHVLSSSSFRDDTSYTNHNTTDISIDDINNGSMIDATNTSNINLNTRDPIIMVVSDVCSPLADDDNVADNEDNNNDTSLSMEHTPKLNESMEEFIRKSLNPPNCNESPIQPTPPQPPPHDDEDDVDMELTPFSFPNRTPMLAMNASRVSVDDNECDTDEENWKQTPLKALQILDSIRDSISMEDCNNNKEEKEEEEEEKEEISKAETSVVDNLFYKSPVTQFKSAITSALNQQSVTPKSTVIEDVATNSRTISMRFGDGETYAFQSVCSSASKSKSRLTIRSKSRSKNKRRKSTSMLQQRALTPEIGSSLCEKTSIIRKMFDELEQEQQIKPIATKHIKSTTKIPIKAIPDRNKNHKKQTFSGLAVPEKKGEKEKKKERGDKLFGSSKKLKKMSTPTYRQRSKSFRAKKSAKIINSESRVNKKKVSIVPSSNDHLYNHNGDKQNRKVFREPTPYKINESKKSTIKRPRIQTISESNSESASVSVEIAKKHLAFDPDKVKSKLFENTSSSTNKRKARGSQTPQSIRSNYKSNVTGTKSRKKNKNWSAVKSKVDSNNNNSKVDSIANKNNNENIIKVSGVKRKLSWSVSVGNVNYENNLNQPAKKKRRISAQPENVKSKNSKKWK